MTEDLLNSILSTRLEVLILVLSLGIARVMGFLYGFIAFDWGLGPMRLIRASIATAISLPVMIVSAPTIITIAADSSALELSFLLPKEIAIGYIFGLLASLPFFAFQYGGAVIDGFRGETDSGQPDPTGGQLQTTAQLHLVIAFFVFFSMSGLAVMIDILFDSFGVWPVEVLLPPLSADAAMVVAELIGKTLMTVALIMLPLIMGLFAIEIAVGFGTRLAQRWGLNEFSFLLKNFFYILLLPLWSMVIYNFAENELMEVFNVLDLMQMLFQ